jgi:hypothetical protein
MLGQLAKELIEKICPALSRREIATLLSEECSLSISEGKTTPEWVALIDRVQLAAIKGSSWDIEEIKSKVSLANTDWRDLLMAVGFGEDHTAHTTWQKSAVQSHDVA